MNKLGSEFLKPFSDYDRPVVGSLTKRQLVMMIGIVLGGVAITTVILLGLPDIFMYLSGAIIVPPFIVYGMKKDIEIKEKVKFAFTIQKRYYQSEIRKGQGYQADEFIQEKSIKETDKI
ncbi:MAG: PrgI family protein [Lactococcus raffinolactis]|nr:PrgI family protein [Lactococcus lactis]MDN6092654.1 PrgI family protein [Lactococcus raffinolactis]MDN6198098.1 PrgI family protein [Lactococcus raffinolactis]